MNDNTELIKKIYQAFATGDIQTILDNVADNASWSNHGPTTIPYAGCRTGRDQIIEFFQAIDSTTTGGRVDVGTFIADGDKVVAIGRYTATVRSNGTQIDTPIAHVFTIESGKVRSWEGFSDSAHVAAAHTVAKKAAG